MREALEKRVAELEAEYRAGQEMLAEVEAKRTDLHQTLLRIGGAIQVLQELLEADQKPESDPGGDPASTEPRLVAG